MPAPHASTLYRGRLARLCILGFLFLLASRPASVSAGGPILVTTTGRPYHWDQSQPILYTVDQGRLGPRSHATAVGMIRQALQSWQEIPYANLEFEAAPE